MTQKRAGWIAGLGGSLALAGGIAAHEAGILFDDAARVARPAGRVIFEPGTPAAIKQGVMTFRDLRNGTQEEKIVVSVACSLMNAFASGASTPDDIAASIKTGLPPDLQVGPEAFVVDRYVDRAANAMFYAEINGGAARWYMQYCGLKP